MATKRGKSQARRNPGQHGGLPGWAWMVLGIVLAVVVILAAPRFLKSDAADGFFRPQPNPDAQPATTASAEDGDAIVPEDAATDAAATASAGKPKPTQFDFYTLLPGEEVALSDAELAASARAEAERAARTRQAEVEPPAQPPPTAPAANATPAGPATDPLVTATAATPEARADSARYLLQAGAFGASGDAEATKARIALLGLSARVESAQINGRTVYRVRLGPYGSARELAEAKRTLADGGLPAMAIKVK
jgi:cell division protein FtsN